MGFNRGDGEFIASTAFGFLKPEEKEWVRWLVFWPARKAWHGIRRVTGHEKDARLPTHEQDAEDQKTHATSHPGNPPATNTNIQPETKRMNPLAAKPPPAIPHHNTNEDEQRDKKISHVDRGLGMEKPYREPDQSPSFPLSASRAKIIKRQPVGYEILGEREKDAFARKPTAGPSRRAAAAKRYVDEDEDKEDVHGDSCNLFVSGPQSALRQRQTRSSARNNHEILDDNILIADKSINGSHRGKGKSRLSGIDLCHPKRTNKSNEITEAGGPKSAPRKQDDDDMLLHHPTSSPQPSFHTAKEDTARTRESLKEEMRRIWHAIESMARVISECEYKNRKQKVKIEKVELAGTVYGFACFSC